MTADAISQVRLSMPVASLPDLELVCAPRSSISTQKYKPKVGGTNYITVPLAQILGGRVPLSPPVTYATAHHVRAEPSRQTNFGEFQA